MPRSDARWVRGLLICLASAVLTASAMVGYVSVVSARDSGDRIVMLGNGNALSVLVTSGSTRLLVATGTNRTDFSNAMNAALPFAARRIDVVLVAGGGAELIVPARAVEQFDPQLVAAIHPLSATDVARNFGANPPEPLAGPVRIGLGERVTVTVETAEGSSDGANPPWRVVVQRGQTRIAVLSSASAYRAFDWVDRIAALVIATGRVDSVDGIHAGAIAGPAIGMDASMLATGVESRRVQYAIGVRPEEAVEMRFVDGGLRLPSSAESLADIRSEPAD